MPKTRSTDGAVSSMGQYLQRSFLPSRPYLLLCYWHCPHSMRSRIYATVRCPSHSPAAAACGGFAAVRPAARRCRSIAARPVPQQHGAAARRAAANAGSATFSAYVRSCAQPCHQRKQQRDALVVEQDVRLPDGAVRYPQDFHSAVLGRIPAQLVVYPRLYSGHDGSETTDQHTKLIPESPNGVTTE